MKTKFYTLFFVLCSFQAIAQHCNNSSQQVLIPRLIKNKAAIKSNLTHQKQSETYIPIAMHLVANNDGTGRISEFEALEVLCKTNEIFQDHDIIFYLAEPFIYHENKTLHESIVSTYGKVLAKGVKAPDAINVFFVDQLNNENFNTGIPATYVPDGDFIALAKTHNRDSYYLSHELGHYFSLIHPHTGWEEAFDENHPNWPIAPEFTSLGVPVEYQDGRNCDIAGDLICDTPPDYAFATLISNCEPYNLGAKDPAEVLVDPMENNFMGYFASCPAYVVTADQKDVIIADLQINHPEFVNNFNGNSGNILNQSTAIHPINQAQMVTAGTIHLDWTAVNNASYYYLEISTRFGFLNNYTKKYYSPNAGITIDSFLPNTQYYWRVWAFNDQGCGEVSIAFEFETSDLSATEGNIKAKGDFSIFPNPIRPGTPLKIGFFNNSSPDILISIMDIHGQISFEQSWYLMSGFNTLEIRMPNLESGIYFVSLSNIKNKLIKKLVLTQ